MNAIFLFLVLLATVPASQSVQWGNNPPDGAVLYACAHGTVSLPWTLILSAGDVIEDIKWFFSGRSQEIIAMEAAGAFNPLPSFSGRLSKITNAGINIAHAQVLESGNFSVEVLAWTAAGDIVTLWRSVYVHVSDDLQTVDGDLHVELKPDAEYDNQTGQFNLVLTCGVFTYPTSPAFQATWQTPSQHTLASSGYHDDRFFLLVPNPVESGAYSCDVPSVQPCIHGNNSAKASITVDKLEARLVVMEATLGAKVTDLQAKNAELQAKDTALQVKVTELQAKDTALQVKVIALESAVDVMKQSVSFHVRGLVGLCVRDVPLNSALKFNTVFSNVGNAYNPSTGLFTAPFTAHYYFIASTEDCDNTRPTYIVLMVDNTEIQLGYSDNVPEWVPAIVYGTVHLTQGQIVWVKVHLYANNSFYGTYTAFSGFLVSHTP